jgi:hypothetical protein
MKTMMEKLQAAADILCGLDRETATPEAVRKELDSFCKEWSDADRDDVLTAVGYLAWWGRTEIDLFETAAAKLRVGAHNMERAASRAEATIGRRRRASTIRSLLRQVPAGEGGALAE